MIDFNGSEFPEDIDLDNASTITNIDDTNRVTRLHKQLVLDKALDYDDAPGTRREQLLRLVEEHYIHPVYGSPVYIDISAMMGICMDNISELVEEIEFSDQINSLTLLSIEWTIVYQLRN